MIKGYVTFYWEDDYKLQKPLFGQLKGIKHKGERPLSYDIKFSDEILSDIEVSRLAEWLQTLLFVKTKLTTNLKTRRSVK